MSHQAFPIQAGSDPSRATILRGATLHLLLGVSGGIALIYEVLWMRRFSTLFGASTPAVAATLSGIFLGFTAGSWLVGIRAVNIRRPWRAYGCLEIAAGLSALLVEPVLHLYGQSYAALYRLTAGSIAAVLVVKTALVMLALFLPASCMGGTVPLLGHALSLERRRLGISAGGLYAANTLGAAAGALSVPLVWLPNLGARASYGFCVILNVVVGAIAWGLDPGESRPTPTARPTAAPAQSSAGPWRLPPFVLAGLAFGSGLCLFILQVVWSRMFAQVHENSIYSFAVVVAVLLLGLAAGAGLARRCLRAGRPALGLLGWGWLGAGMLICLTPPLFLWLTHGLAYLGGAGGWGSYGLRLIGWTVPTVLAPALCAGMGLPLLLELGGQATARPPGAVLGKLISLNTLGAIAGALAGAFLLPGSLGLWGSLVGVGLLLMAAGEFCLSGRGSRSTQALGRRCLCGGLVAVELVLASTGRLPRVRIQETQGERLLSLREGSHGIVAVVENGDSRRIKLNNHYVLGGSASTADERVQGHLPLLLHPAPRRVAFLGLGTGITAGAALLHPVDRVTAIELVPEVAAAARDYFGEENLDLAHSARATVVTEDARTFLSASAQRFDVIVGDLVVPWRQGEASLYTAEHFATVRRALASGGIFCQWLPLFQLSEEEFNIVTATFLDLFPNATLWRGDFAPNEPALGLIGHAANTVLDPAAIERSARALKSDALNPALGHPAGLWVYLVGRLDARSKRWVDARRNRENAPWLELLGPLHHAGAARTRTPPFVGRALARFLDEVRALPLAGSPLERLEGPPLEWRQAGAELGQASLLLAEGQARAAQQQFQAAALLLPQELHEAFGVAAPSSPPPSKP